MDVKRDLLGNYFIYTKRGKKNTGIKLEDWVKNAESSGAGEIIINNINRDGVMNGYDFNLLSKAAEICTIPVVACGGAGSLEDLKEAVSKASVSGVAAGSLFVYWGSKKGVLINYPNREDLKF